VISLTQKNKPLTERIIHDLLYACWTMRRFSALIVASLLCGCSASKQPEVHSVKVLSTVAMIDDLVRVVAGDQVEVQCLIANGLDPHSYELVKGDGERIAGSDLVFYGGLGLEHHPSLKQQLTAHPNSVSLGALLQQQNPTRIITVDGQPDPHLWTDVGLWALTVPLIADRLAQVDAEHAADYHRRGKELQLQLEQLDRQIAEELASIPAEQRYLVSAHSAFNYFVRAYLATDEERATDGWRQRSESPEGISPEAEMSLRDIQRVVDYALAHHVTALFPESNVNEEPLLKVADVLRHRGLSVTLSKEPLYGDAMAPRGTYQQMARHNAKVVASLLKGSS
jgi:manganese/zinc/iron transport system substrate-binding protein